MFFPSPRIRTLHSKPATAIAINEFMMVPRVEAIQLARLAVNDCVEQCYAVGFGPQANHSSFVKRLILDVEQFLLL